MGGRQRLKGGGSGDLAAGLALYGTATATATAARVAEEDPDDPERVIVYEPLYAMDVLAGNLPGGRQARWRQWLEEECEHSSAILGRFRAEAVAAPSNFIPFPREVSKVGRNDPCPCGSGRKYKQCCLGKEDDGIEPLA